MGPQTETRAEEKTVFDKTLKEDEQIEELIQLLRRLRLQTYKLVRVVVKVRHI